MVLQQENPDSIAADAGSLDPGPYYLGSGLPHVAEYKMKNDCRIMMEGLKEKKTTLVMGSAGGSGGRPHIQWHLGLMEEVAREMGTSFQVAVIDTTLEKEYVKEQMKNHPVPPLQHDEPLTEEIIDSCTEIVAQIGVEPIIQALDMGPDIVLAGRACDNACFAAEPIRQGFDKGIALHLGKIIECGSACSIPLPGSKIMRTPMVGTLTSHNYFYVRPGTDDWISTVRSIAGHEAYERTDPLYQAEPGGFLDLRGVKLTQHNEQCVKIEGSRWIKDEGNYHVKLEGCEKVGHRSLFIVGARDQTFIKNLDYILSFTKNRIIEEFQPKGLVEGKDYHVLFKVYGRDGVMGPLEPVNGITSHELGIIMEVIAETAEMAHEICYFGKYGMVWCNYPGRSTISGNVAYAFSPSILDGGEAYRLSIHHLLPIPDPSLFPIKLVEVG